MDPQLIHKLVTLLDGPDFVKSAEFNPPQAKAGSAAYAAPMSGEYPCHTAADTWLSAAQLHIDGKDRSDFAEVSARIKKFASIHDILVDVLAIPSKLGSLAKAAEVTVDDSYFAYIGPDGTRYLRMANPEETRKAAHYVVNNRADIPYMVRQNMAARILSRAADGDIELLETGDELRKTAGHGLCSGTDLAQTIRDRVVTSRRGPGAYDEDQAALLKFASELDNNPRMIDDTNLAFELAETIDTFDRDNGLLKKGFAPIEIELFGLTEQTMLKAAQEHVQDPNGRIYRLADLREVPVDPYGEFASAIGRTGDRYDLEKLASIMPVTTRTYAYNFSKTLDSLGIKPVAKVNAEASMEDEINYLMGVAGLTRD